MYVEFLQASVNLQPYDVVQFTVLLRLFVYLDSLDVFDRTVRL